MPPCLLPAMSPDHKTYQRKIVCICLTMYLSTFLSIQVVCVGRPPHRTRADWGDDSRRSGEEAVSRIRLQPSAFLGNQIQGRVFWGKQVEQHLAIQNGRLYRQTLAFGIQWCLVLTAPSDWPSGIIWLSAVDSAFSRNIRIWIVQEYEMDWIDPMDS